MFLLINCHLTWYEQALENQGLLDSHPSNKSSFNLILLYSSFGLIKKGAFNGWTDFSLQYKTSTGKRLPRIERVEWKRFISDMETAGKILATPLIRLINEFDIHSAIKYLIPDLFLISFLWCFLEIEIEGKNEQQQVLFHSLPEVCQRRKHC